MSKKMNQQNLYTQQVIKGLEFFVPTPNSDNNIQTNVSKIYFNNFISYVKIYM
ncbi:hypothetical protein BDCR2A_01337 [Borrelia duttonii CR2A]|uniref:Uncharacterized protein n=1 Tax=Borrelia duttonii CR2A TaxID=1432657 RepID=W6TXA6_9SPIR|nr:hypothetical protein BDCR2A_01337 [Borrelia duttonii CR2A]